MDDQAVYSVIVPLCNEELVILLIILCFGSSVGLGIINLIKAKTSTAGSAAAMVYPIT